MSSEKTQMVDLLSSSTKKSLTIKNLSKDGFLIDNKLYNYSILISSENIHTWNIDSQITDKNFNFINIRFFYGRIFRSSFIQIKR